MRSSRINARAVDGPSVVFATERMDDDPAWRLLRDGELVHVGTDMALTSTTGVLGPPRHRLTVADLNPVAAASQTIR